MSENQRFLINGLTPEIGSEFQVRTNAVRLFGANLAALYNIEVYVGSTDTGAWVPAFFNAQPLQISDSNNILVLIVAGQYRVTESNGDPPLPNAMVWYEESIETDHDARIMYVLQTPSPPAGP